MRKLGRIKQTAMGNSIQDELLCYYSSGNSNSISPNPLRSHAGSNMELTSWKEEEGYFNCLLVKD